MRGLPRIVLNGAPEVGDEAVLVVDRLDARVMRPVQENSTGPEKRLDVIGHVAEAAPHNVSHAALATEPGERSLKVAHDATAFRRQPCVALYSSRHSANVIISPHAWRSKAGLQRRSPSRNRLPS